MSDKTVRLSQLARTLNVGTSTIVEYLAKKGFEVENNPNSKVTGDQVAILRKEFQNSALDKEEAHELHIGSSKKNVIINADSVHAHNEEKRKEDDQEPEITIKNVHAPTAPKKEEVEVVSADRVKLEGIKVLGKIDLNPAKTVQTAKNPTPKVEQPQAPVQKPIETTPKVEHTETPKVEQQKKVETVAPVAEAKPVIQETPKKEVVAQEVKKPQEQKPVHTAQSTQHQAKRDDAPKQQHQHPKKEAPKVVVKETPKPAPVVTPVFTPAEDTSGPVIEAKADALKGLTVLGKIELPTKKPISKKPDYKKPGESNEDRKKKRKRVRVDKPVNVQEESKKQAPGTPGQGSGTGSPNRGPGQGGPNRGPGQGGPNRGPGQSGPNNNAGNNNNNRFKGKPANNTHAKPAEKKEITDKEIKEKIKSTIQKISDGGNKLSSRSKYRKEKRNAQANAREEDNLRDQEDAKFLKVTEFISANDLASMMDVSVNEVISTCMSLGMFVSINQRLDAEAITVIADEFGYDVKFSTVDDEDINAVVEDTDAEEDLVTRAPIVTIMGHVDHGKTSLLDYIRKAKVAEGEAGGITQHIGAYSVKTDSGKRITFLDTPGHEAFTAMRARGAKITDVVILVVAADDRVMPQTKEAINHAQLAGVPIVIALNKIDKPAANPEKIREELAKENILVEEWGGKYQCQEVSAKSGLGINELLDKVLLEAEMMALTANPNRAAIGTIVEASLDKGRGYLSTALVEKGTLKIGDIVVAGQYYGRVKAMLDHRGKRMKEAGPSSPVQILGLDGAPQAGDKITVVETDREAREITNKRSQLLREQSLRTKKHLTLDEIGRRLAVGNFKELNLIIKGDVDGSVEALTDSLLKLSTAEVQVNVIHKAVGPITESDVLLASASDAIVIGFQVRPIGNAKKLAENEGIEIRAYSIIYKAIDEMRIALEGLLEPTIEEFVTGNIEIREVFKITKVGTVAGCYVLDGFVKRNNKIRVIRQSVVVYEGEIQALKRFKDDVSEVKHGYECGLSIKNFNDLQVGDVIESYDEREVKRKLK